MQVQVRIYSIMLGILRWRSGRHAEVVIIETGDTNKKISRLLTGDFLFNIYQLRF